MMLVEPRKWKKYLIKGEDKKIIGIRDDAPDDVKKEFEEWYNSWEQQIYRRLRENARKE